MPTPYTLPVGELQMQLQTFRFKYTSISLFFSALLEKHLNSFCQLCSLQSAGEQEPRPQNVHHVDKLTQSASSRSISPPHPFEIQHCCRFSGVFLERDRKREEEASSSLEMTEWEGRRECLCVAAHVKTIQRDFWKLRWVQSGLSSVRICIMYWSLGYSSYSWWMKVCCLFVCVCVSQRVTLHWQKNMLL